MTARERLAVIGGVRTPFVRAGTEFQRTSAADLASLTFRELLSRTAIDPADLDEVLLGCAGQPLEAQNLARVAALRAGVPEAVPALTVHRNCASGMEALTQALVRVRAREASLLLVGGVEAMSRAPVLFPDKTQAWLMQLGRRQGLGQRLAHVLRLRPSHLRPRSALVMGLTDPVSGMIMGDTAEVLAREFDIPRAAQDGYALQSHARARAAWDAGRLADETFAVVPPPGYAGVCERDNGMRDGLTLEKLARLPPYFDRRYGSVTVGNSCQITDGAVAMLVASEERAERLGLPCLGYVREYAYAGLDPRRMGLGPVFATRALLRKTGGSMADFDLVELNEAFAAQVLACHQAFGDGAFAARHFGADAPVGALDPERCNVNGGAIALGHPVGATGARLVLTLLHELRRRQRRRGLATLCIGGGQGAALDVEVG